jgi:hypothetical protein
MNIINAVTLLTSEKPSEVMEGKKYFFGFDAKLEIQKIVYAFFLDTYKPQGGENPSFDKLTKYEFFAGSLTAKRLCQELEAFLQSKPPLQPKTYEKIQAFVALLKEAQELSTHIDLLRSSNLPLIFVAVTGIDSSKEGYKVNLDSDQLQKLTASAIQKVKTLQSGEKALFLTGSSLHETLACVERQSERLFKFSIYDSANAVKHYVMDDKHMTDGAFWSELFLIKFSPSNAKRNLLTLAQEFSNAIATNERGEFSCVRQRKQTCHFRCLLAFLKDQIIGESSLELNDACAEWQLFKKTFGEFLLKNSDLQDEQLIHFSEKKQKARAKKQERAEVFLTCIKEGKGQETLQCYQALLHNLKRLERPCRTAAKDPSLSDFLNIEKELIKTLESYPIAPEELASFLREINNPWVEESLKLFGERFEMRQRAFQIGLEEELTNAESRWESFKQFALSFITPPKNAIIGPAIHQDEVERLLDLFEKDPKKLHFLKEKPHCRAVFMRAIQLGHIEQVQKIAYMLPKEDLNQILNLFSIHKGFFIPTLPTAYIKQFIAIDPKSAIAEHLSLMLCLKAFSEAKVSEVIEIAKITRPYCMFKVMLKYLILHSSEDEIIKMLSSIKDVNKKLTATGEWFLIEQILHYLIEKEDINLIEKVEKLNDPKLNKYLESTKFVIYYNQRNLEEVKNLSIINKSLENLLKGFSLDEAKEMLDLLMKTENNSSYFACVAYRHTIDALVKAEAETSLRNLFGRMAKTPGFIENYNWEKLQSNSIIFIIKMLEPNFNTDELGDCAGDVLKEIMKKRSF